MIQAPFPGGQILNKYSLKTAIPFSVLFLCVCIGLPLYLYHKGLSLVSAGVFVFMFVSTLLSITAGYHRLFAHRSYQASPILKALFLFFGAGAFQESCLKWSSEHRVHHRFVDTDKDPYSIKKGFFWAHMGWMLSKEDPKAPHPKDLKSDPLVRFQHRYWFPIGMISGFGLPLAIGWSLGDPWGGLFFGGPVRIFFAHHVTFFINSIAHMFGSQPYSTEGSARDSWWLAFFTFGEGYHNFHHTYPSDYRNGIRFYHWDPSKWLIQGLRMLRLTWDLKRTPEEVIVRKKVQNQFVHISLPKIQELEALRQKLYAELMARLDEFSQNKKAWIATKREMATQKITKAEHELEHELARLKEKIELNRKSYQESYDNWKQFLHYVQKQRMAA